MISVLPKHEISQYHVQWLLDYTMFNWLIINILIDSQRKAEIYTHNEQVKKHKNILKIMIEVVCYFSIQNSGSSW